MSWVCVGSFGRFAGHFRHPNYAFDDESMISLSSGLWISIFYNLYWKSSYICVGNSVWCDTFHLKVLSMVGSLIFKFQIKSLGSLSSAKSSIGFFCESIKRHVLNDQLGSQRSPHSWCDPWCRNKRTWWLIWKCKDGFKNRVYAIVPIRIFHWMVATSEDQVESIGEGEIFWKPFAMKVFIWSILLGRLPWIRGAMNLVKTWFTCFSMGFTDHGSHQGFRRAFDQRAFMPMWLLWLHLICCVEFWPMKNDYSYLKKRSFRLIRNSTSELPDEISSEELTNDLRKKRIPIVSVHDGRSRSFWIILGSIIGVKTNFLCCS